MSGIRLDSLDVLNVDYAGVALVSDLLVVGLTPAVDWRLRFAAINGGAIDDVHAFDNLRAIGLTDYRPRRVDVKATLNVQDFTDVVAFEYVPVLSISSFSPSGGPAQGGTQVILRGSGIRRGPNATCKIGDATVPASFWDGERLVCSTPTMVPTMTYQLGASVNGQNYAVALRGFRSYGAPHISHLSLTHGPMSGGTELMLHGSGAPSRRKHDGWAPDS